MSVAQLQLVKRKDADGSDIDMIDLLSLPTELQYQGWQQATPAQQGQATVNDVITLLLNAGSDDTLAATLQAIDSKVKQTAWAQDPLNPIGVWLRSKLSTETYARQAFIKALARSPLEITDPLAYQSILKGYNLGITRMPVWEDVLASSIAPGSITAHGGLFTYSVSGDAHARVAKVDLAGKTVSADADAYHEVWLGAKGDRYGVTPANFVPVWDFGNKGTYGAYDVTKVADSTALNGYKLVCSFATIPTMSVRTFLPSSVNSATHPEDQRGRYIALLRAKTSDATLVCNVRIGQGYYDPDQLAYTPRYQISNASGGWKYYTLGTIKLPANDGFYDQGMDRVSLWLAAEKQSGTGNLEMDDVVLIPSEHSIHAVFPANIGFGVISGFDTRGYILTRPDQKMFAVVSSASFPQGTRTWAPPDQISWSLPTGTNNVIVGCVQSTYSIKADAFTPALTIYPSYSSLRGAA